MPFLQQVSSQARLDFPTEKETDTSDASKPEPKQQPKCIQCILDEDVPRVCKNCKTEKPKEEYNTRPTIGTLPVLAPTIYNTKTAAEIQHMAKGEILQTVSTLSSYPRRTNEKPRKPPNE